MSWVSKLLFILIGSVWTANVAAVAQPAAPIADQTMGSPWSGASFDPTNGLVYVNSNNTPYILRLKANSFGGYDFMGY